MGQSPIPIVGEEKAMCKRAGLSGWRAKGVDAIVLRELIVSSGVGAR